MPDSTLAPFYHGVASGDPLPTSVLLWTRVTLDVPLDTLQLHWIIAKDTALTQIVNSGTAGVGPYRDYTVKVDATQLQPNSWYYYQFDYQGHKSIIGRTRTLPQGHVEHLRFAVMSCADYQNGYYHAYRDMAQRNTVDIALHLGDYIYEYAAGSALSDRNHVPANEIITLSDYRLRHSLYKLDPDLRFMQQQLPMIAVWDDHETANNSWTGGAENHQPATEGPWEARKAAGKEAYLEWMPIRENVSAEGQIYRKFDFGDLAELFMLDTRLEGRNTQLAASDPATNDTSRTIISAEQYNWLTGGLKASTAKWNILGQQVMVAPLTAFGNILNPDQWDGYPAQRKRLFDFLVNDSISNAVVLTGDIHTAWANDLPYTNYIASTGANSAAVEFVATSITSANGGLAVPPAFVQTLNPHVKFVDLQQHGYFILDLTPERAQADYVFVSDISKKPYTSSIGASWGTQRGTRHLDAGTATTGGMYPPLAPNSSITSSVHASFGQDIVNLSLFPNPFLEQVVLQFATRKAGSVYLHLNDTNGKIVWQERISDLPAGLHHLQFNGAHLPRGIYTMTIEGEKGASTGRLLKVE